MIVLSCQHGMRSMMVQHGAAKRIRTFVKSQCNKLTQSTLHLECVEYEIRKAHQQGLEVASCFVSPALLFYGELPRCTNSVSEGRQRINTAVWNRSVSFFASGRSECEVQ